MLEPSGYGLAALSYVKALLNNDVALQWCPLISHDGGYQPWTKAAQAEDQIKQLLELVESDIGTREKLLRALAPLKQSSHAVLHTVPEYWPMLIEESHFNIGYTVWETDRLPKHFPPLLNQVDEIALPSRFSLQALLRSGVKKPIRIIPHILDLPTSAEASLLSSDELPNRLIPSELASHYVFYSINEWNARKANWTLLRVFLNTFTAHDKVALILKTSATGPKDEADPTLRDTRSLAASMLKEYPNPPPVRVITERLDQQQVALLHQQADCFVSATHAEGWGLGAFEAAGHGNPVCITGWSGHLDFLDPTLCQLIKYDLVETQNSLGQQSYSAEQRWAKINEQDAARRLRQIYLAPHSAKQKARTLAQQLSARYAPEQVSKTMLECSIQQTIPKQFHFVFGLKAQTEEFHLAYYLCLKSCIDVNQPDAVHFHYHYSPHGHYWDLIKHHLILHHVPLEGFVVESDAYQQHAEGKFIAQRELNYAHQADFIRLKALLEYGGIYADMDTLFVNPLPAQLFTHECVLGQEQEVFLEGSDEPSLSLCNAFIMAQAGATFIQRWLQQSYQSFDGTWSKHSCQLAAKLAKQFPNEVTVLPERHFYKHRCTVQGIKTLFEDLDDDYSEVYSMHMWNHLWWDKHRTDFSNFHSELLTEQYVAQANSTYSFIAKRFLPEHQQTQAQHAPYNIPSLSVDWRLIEQEGRLMLSNDRSEQRFEINAATFEIASLCDEKRNVEQIIYTLSQRYAEQGSDIAQDVTSLLEQLRAQNIITFTCGSIA